MKKRITDDVLSQDDYKNFIGSWDDSPKKFERLWKHDAALRARVRELEDELYCAKQGRICAIDAERRTRQHYDTLREAVRVGCHAIKNAPTDECARDEIADLEDALTEGGGDDKLSHG